MPISDKDRELLAILRENCRLPIASIAKRLRISRTTAQTRLEKLEREGIITGYGVRLSDQYLSTLVRAHILITIAPKALESVTQGLKDIQQVQSVFSVNGTFDLIAIVQAPDVSELDTVIDKIGALKGVERTLTSIILSTRVAR
ncbi:Lrp/AsnC family transcriptional regulator (plasmid) [Agrobacterium leguminum]|uniref:Transcriptional regulator AsnC family n=1 Tax=Agrobacterium deltaense NCPPB 1641 TaxID=1183425 RepID=A0A1S7U9N4_9HYPH|nr:MULTISPECIES: Lrp/AsnC family transcriptional regulator [Agrobacterium]WFS70102.1 Lrp/AsnC family transcriptional regulator [Agrobacterium leguminum]CVI63512.1 Transcriptional regulator AsnC family [Agrobacterium deltaense NCPPB 1641]